MSGRGPVASAEWKGLPPAVPAAKTVSLRTTAVKTPRTPKPSAPKTKVVSFRVSSRLADATLRIYAQEAAKHLLDWAIVGATPALGNIRNDAAIRLVGAVDVRVAKARS